MTVKESLTDAEYALYIKEVRNRIHESAKLDLSGNFRRALKEWLSDDTSIYEKSLYVK